MNDTRRFTMRQQASTIILVVDELLLVSSALAYSLRDKGFDAHSLRASNLQEVQRDAMTHLPGLVLLGLDLGSGPDSQPIDGVDLIGPLCALGWTVMVMTGTASLDRLATAIAHGDANWIAKGATFAELVHAAGEIMAGREQLLPADRTTLIEHHRQMQATQQA